MGGGDNKKVTFSNYYPDEVPPRRETSSFRSFGHINNMILYRLSLTFCLVTGVVVLTKLKITFNYKNTEIDVYTKRASRP